MKLTERTLLLWILSLMLGWTIGAIVFGFVYHYREDQNSEIGGH